MFTKNPSFYINYNTLYHVAMHTLTLIAIVRVWLYIYMRLYCANINNPHDNNMNYTNVLNTLSSCLQQSINFTLVSHR